VLGALTRDEDLDVIVQGTHHRDAEVRRASIEAASSFGTRFPETRLVLSLTDEQPAVRVAAAAALRAYPSTHVREALLAAVRDPDPWVVAAALRSIGSVGGDRSVPTLMDAAQSTCSPIAIAALQSLFRINPPGLRSALEQAVTHVDPEVVREAVAVSMRLSADSARDLLMPCLSSRFWLVRSAAAEALANRGIRVPRAVVQDLLLSEREPLAQESIERLLTASGEPV
jgi:HEAT repeat protein